MNLYTKYIPELNSMKKYPNELYYLGNTKLLKKQKVSIVGTRKPSQYSKSYVNELSRKLSLNNICIVSGAAIGTDTIAHKAAGENNTIAVMANSLDIKYPAINRKLINEIENNGLVLSTYKKDTPAKKYTFVLRNEIVVALGDILIVSQADINSGTISSINYALKMNKKVYTLPHRLNESLGTQHFLEQNKIEAIYDIDKFIEKLSPTKKQFKQTKKDEFLEYCKTYPTYESAVNLFQDKVFEYELEGKIKIENGIIYPH